MSGGHDHGVNGHHHPPTAFGRAFAIGTVLNLGFVAIEATYGLLSGSMALVADAGHNLSDVLALVMAWGAATLANRTPSTRYTYGFKSASILAAVLNALLLLATVAIIAVEAIGRFGAPVAVAGDTVMIVAAIGVLVNGVTAWLFASGRKDDLNVRGAFLHMAADAAVSAGVVIAGFVIARTGWRWVDPAASLLITAIIAAGTWGLLRASLSLSLQAVPAGVDPDAIARFLRDRPGVTDIHDLHIWPLSTTETALTVHLVVPSGMHGDGFPTDLAAALHTRFGIDHATIQIETGDIACRQQCHTAV